MRPRRMLAGLLVTLATAGASSWAAATAEQDDSPGRSPELRWSELPSLPANPTDWSDAIPVGEPYWRSLGLAGPIAGVDGDVLIVGGGANFPEPAKTANRENALGKVYWDDVFVMRRDRAGRLAWLDRTFRLPDSIAYAATLSTRRGVLVIGGEGFRGGPNGAKLAPVQQFADVFYLRYDAARRGLETERLPSLPRPMSYAVAGIVDDVVYVAHGGDAYSLDLARPQAGWERLPPWPGDPRSVAMGVAQGGRFYLMGGRSQAGGRWRFHRDAYAYDPEARAWERVADLPWGVTAGLAYPVGDRYILVAGGDSDLDRWNLIEEQTALRNREPKGSPAWHEHNDVITWLHDHHTGFNADLLLYDVRNDSWSVEGHFPGPPPVTTPAVTWGSDLLAVSGEIRPGVRTPRVWRAAVGRE
jgi:N-acetylneuraminate epimerase